MRKSFGGSKQNSIPIARRSQQQAEELRSRSERIEHLKLMVEKLRHMIFGTKSEKIVLQARAAGASNSKNIETTQAEKPKPLPNECLPAARNRSHVPNASRCLNISRAKWSRTLLHGDCCPDCGGQLRQFGEDISEQLEYIPESFKVIRHVRPKFTCTGCDRVVEAPAPSRPIERGLAGPGSAGSCDRLEVRRSSAAVSGSRRSTPARASRSRAPRMAGWVGAPAICLRPLVDAIQKHVLAGRKLHADDTPMPVLAPGNGKTKTGRLWTYVRDDRPAGEDTAPAVWFAYSEDRKGEHPRQHLKNFKGSSAGRRLCGLPSSIWRWTIYEAACWAHARRKFHEIHVVHASPTTTEALARIGALYAIEDEIRGKPADLRLSIRQARARPLLDDLRNWMEKALRSLSVEERDCGCDPICALALACPHTLHRRWPARDRQQRRRTGAAAVALGRKNFLFAGSDRGGERAAAMYTLIGSAKLNGLDPELYLRTVLAQIADHPISHIQDLLPWNLAPSLQTHSSQTRMECKSQVLWHGHVRSLGSVWAGYDGC